MAARKKPAQDQVPEEGKGKPVAAKRVPAKKAAPAGKGKAPRKSPPKAPSKTPRKPAKKAAPAKGSKDQKPASDAPAQDEDPLCGLSAQEALVVDRYLATYNMAQAYIEAGYTARNQNVAYACASRLLSSAKSRRYRAKRLRELMGRNEDAQDRLLGMFVDMAYADARELSEMRVGNCRCCYGDGHRYQFTQLEWERHVEAHEKAMLKAEAKGVEPPEFDPKGGPGFNRTREPNEECPECGGEGVPRVVFKDTQGLSPAAVSLYAGAKIGKDGLEVKSYDQKGARETLAKILKMFDDRSVVEVKFDPAELEAKYGEKMRAAHEGMARMRAERLADRDKRESEG